MNVILELFLFFVTLCFFKWFLCPREIVLKWKVCWWCVWWAGAARGCWWGVSVKDTNGSSQWRRTLEDGVEGDSREIKHDPPPKNSLFQEDGNEGQWSLLN